MNQIENTPANLTIEERRNRDNTFRVTPDTKMGGSMTYAEWMEHGREVAIRARVNLMENGIPTGRTHFQDAQDHRALRLIEQRAAERARHDQRVSVAWDAAHQEATDREMFTPARREVRAAFDARAAELGSREYEAGVGQLAALQTLEYAPDSIWGKELASHVIGAGYIIQHLNVA